MVKRIRWKIRELPVGKDPEKTPDTINTVVQTVLYERRATGTQTEPILTQPVKEHHAILAEVATKIEVVPSYDLAIQTEVVPSYTMATEMEAWTSHNKGTQTIGIPSHGRSTQTTIQAKDIMMRNNPSILNLQEDLARAWLAVERLELETISQQKYQEL